MACRVSNVLATVTIVLCTFSLPACDDYDDTELWNTVNDHESRLEALEQWQAEVNNNIAALQELLNTNDMITSVTPVTMGDETVGYTISFLHSSPITIYNGAQGEQGEAGETPQIGLTQGDDGNWYWTLNGELMTDADGNPIRANGKDGQDGEDGQDGADGEDGADGSTGPQGPAGADAPKPQIMLGKDVTGKIETDGGSIIDDAWYLSVDNGATWHRVSGKDGTSGDSLFQSVTQDEKEGYVIFTLSDNTEIKVPLYQGITLTFTSGETPLDPNKPITVTGSTLEISYTVNGITDAKLSAIPSAEGWSATVEDKAIIVTVTTEAASECDLLVTATDNAGKSVSYTLSLRNGFSIDETTGAYTVFTPAGLLAWNEAVQSDLSLNCTLTEDINMTGKEWTPIGNSFQTYNGTFDGQGYSITGLNASSLFGGIGESATVKNLQLVDVELYESSGGTAGIVTNNYGQVIACSVTGNINAFSTVGGIANANQGSITACWFAGTLRKNESGGIVNYNFSIGSITACYWCANTDKGVYNNEGGTVEATKVDDSTVTWQTAVDGMNAALTDNSYQWVLGTDGLPVLQKQ